MLKNKFAPPTISRSKASRARNFGHPSLQGALHRAEWFTYSSTMCLCRPRWSNSRWSHASMVERCSEWMGPCPHSHVTQLHHPISLEREYHHFSCWNYSWFELFGPLDLRRASLHAISCPTHTWIMIEWLKKLRVTWLGTYKVPAVKSKRPNLWGLKAMENPKRDLS